MADTTVQTLYLGNIANNLNPNNDYDSENASVLLGMSFGSTSNPLYLSGAIQEVTFTDANDDGSVRPGGMGGDTINGQLTTGMVGVSATVIYSDGTTGVAQFTIAQNVGGDLYIIQSTGAHDGDLDGALEVKPISSIVIDSIRFSNSGGNLNSNIDGNDFSVCFNRGTFILTDRGEVPVENLRIGDLIMTKDHGLKDVRWIGSRILSSATLEINPQLRPIRIRSGALGRNTPTQDLVVSPQHRVLVRSKIAQRLFNTDEVLVAAKQLLLIDGIDIAFDIHEVEYFHFLLSGHEVVISNGAETESLYTGRQALKSLGAEALKEIFTIFPELRDLDETSRPEEARLLLNGRQGRKLAQRHAQNSRVLVSTDTLGVSVEAWD
ncbi:Hint domain-containing protein [Paracoccus cavernae]|uniref:Hint domain-containing protein n=1 Tax=Paracoccus cavernae TaxID=1571207 RepID=UPI0035F2C06D